MKKLEIPADIEAYIEQHEYWETQIDDVDVTIDRVEYKGVDTLSYQFSISSEENGFELEEKLLTFIRSKNINLAEQIKTDSESATCVLWLNNQSEFEAALAFELEYLEAK